MGEGFAQSCLDAVQNRRDISHHIIRRKADDTETLPFEIHGSPRIMRDLRDFTMLASVNLDNEASGQTDKIAKIGTKRKLSAEAKAIDLPLTQMLPEPLFGFGCGSPQLPGTECSPPPKRRLRRRFAPSRKGRG